MQSVSLPLTYGAVTMFALAFWAWRTHESFGLGQCRQCGYDLRASPQRCPECGLQFVA